MFTKLWHIIETAKYQHILILNPRLLEEKRKTHDFEDEHLITAEVSAETMHNTSH